MTRNDPSGPPADWNRLAHLFEKAGALTSQERARMLAELATSAPELAAELTAMLDATPTAAGLELEERLRRPEAAPSLGAGDRVGAWRLLRFIARGGMGEVYFAERADGAFEQQVAIKLLRAGAASADLLERFQLERNLLARLEHPAIVPLLDAGTTADGRPFLALRYVEGRQITDFCRETAATPSAKAELFVELCRAVQFAHSRLVVHRDLKPSNVLVSADGRVHLLDFGIAKLLAPRDDSRQPTQGVELAPMTPQRAAPEQRRGAPVTTATDVWALGLLLHEIFAGELPELDESSPAQRIDRAASPIPRDLAAVVGRALAAEPARRYGSAGELAEEVERWLAGEPVKARPDSFGYRAARFIARHPVAVGLSSAALVLLSTLTLVSISSGREASRQRAAAAREATRSDAVVDLVVDLFGGLDPLAGADLDTVRVSDLVADGAARAAKLGDQPDVQARLRHVLGRIQLERSAWIPAIELLRAAHDAELARLPVGDTGVVPLMLDYARALHATGDRRAAIDEANAALARVEGAAAPELSVLAQALGTVGALEGGERGEERIARSLEILRATPGASRLDIAANLTSLAWLRRTRGNEAETRERFAEALAILRAERGETHPHTLSLRSNLASLLPEPADRVREHREILTLRRGKLGERHYAVANSWSALGAAQGELGDWDEAIRSFENAHEIWIETGSAANPMALQALRSLARAADAAHSGVAGAHWRRLDQDLASASLEPRSLAAFRVDLALHFLASGELTRAESEASTALGLLLPEGVPAPTTAARAQAARGRALIRLGRATEAAPLLAAALAQFGKRAPDDTSELDAARAALEGLPGTAAIGGSADASRVGNS